MTDGELIVIYKTIFDTAAITLAYSIPFTLIAVYACRQANKSVKDDLMFKTGAGVIVTSLVFIGAAGLHHAGIMGNIVMSWLFVGVLFLTAIISSTLFYFLYMYKK